MRIDVILIFGIVIFTAGTPAGAVERDILELQSFPEFSADGQPLGSGTRREEHQVTLKMNFVCARDGSREVVPKAATALSRANHAWINWASRIPGVERVRYIDCDTALMRPVEFFGAKESVDYSLRILSRIESLSPGLCLARNLQEAVTLSHGTSDWARLQAELRRVDCRTYWLPLLFSAPYNDLRRTVGDDFSLGLTQLTSNIFRSFPAAPRKYSEMRQGLLNLEVMDQARDSSQDRLRQYIHDVTAREYLLLAGMSREQAQDILGLMNRVMGLDVDGWVARGAVTVSTVPPDRLENFLSPTLNLSADQTDWYPSSQPCGRLDTFSSIYFRANRSTRARWLEIVKSQGRLPERSAEALDFLDYLEGRRTERPVLRSADFTRCFAATALKDADAASLRQVSLSVARLYAREADLRDFARKFVKEFEASPDRHAILTPALGVYSTRDLTNFERRLRGETPLPYSNGRRHDVRPAPAPTVRLGGSIYETRAETSDSDYALLDRFEALRPGELATFAFESLLLHHLRGVSSARGNYDIAALSNADREAFENARRTLREIAGRVRSLDQWKAAVESGVLIRGRSIRYNVAADSVFDILQRNELQCSSGTALLLATALAMNAQTRGERVLVAIFTNGHVLPGYLQKNRSGRWELFGVETTSAQNTAVAFGETSRLAIPMVVVSLNDYLFSELLSHSLVQPEIYQRDVLERMKSAYGFRDFARPETPISFAFGRVFVPSGVFERGQSRLTAEMYRENVAENHVRNLQRRATRNQQGFPRSGSAFPVNAEEAPVSGASDLRARLSRENTLLRNLRHVIRGLLNPMCADEINFEFLNRWQGSTDTVLIDIDQNGVTFSVGHLLENIFALAEDPMTLSCQLRPTPEPMNLELEIPASLLNRKGSQIQLEEFDGPNGRRRIRVR